MKKESLQRKDEEDDDKSQDMNNPMPGCQHNQDNSAPAYTPLEKVESTRPGKMSRQWNISSRRQGGGYSGYACRILQLQRKVAQQVNLGGFHTEVSQGLWCLG